MDPEDAIIFCQDDFSRLSFVVLEDMRQRGELCDVIIKVRNRRFAAHRVIVAGGIPYFRSKFATDDEKSGEIDVLEANFDPEAMECVIRFVYCGKIKISVENVQSLLAASHMLRLSQVRDACVGFLSARLQVSSVVQVCTLAHNLNDAGLIENCNNFIGKHFEQFSDLEDLSLLPLSSFKQIISEDTLNVTSEDKVFKAVLKRVEASPSKRQKELPELLPKVRMIYLPLKFIDHISSMEFIKASKPCLDLVDEVKTYNRLPKEKAAGLNLNTRPRKYYSFSDGIYAICLSKTFEISAHYCDLVNEKWHNLGSKILKNDCVAQVAALGEKLYVFLNKSIQTFNVRTYEWEAQTPEHEFINGAAVLSLGNTIYCFGSVNDRLSDKVRSFDVERNEWLRECQMGISRCYSAAASLGESIYLTGGQWGGGKRFNRVDKYSPSLNKWDEIAPMLTPRSAHGCTEMLGKIYVCGGRREKIGSSDLCILTSPEMYDPSTKQWAFISRMRIPRCSFSLVSHNSKMYTIGGTTGSKNADNDVEIYDAESGQWTKLSRFLPAFSYTRAVAVSVIPPLH